MYINLIGLTVVAQRPLSAAELEGEGWPTNAEVIALEFDDGTVVYPAVNDQLFLTCGPAILVGYNTTIIPIHKQYFQVKP